MSDLEVTVITVGGDEVAKLLLEMRGTAGKVKLHLEKRYAYPFGAQDLLCGHAIVNNWSRLWKLPQPLVLTLVLHPFNEQEALFRAALHDHPDAVRAVLSRAGSVEERRAMLLATSTWGNTALHYAASSGHVSTCQALLGSVQTQEERFGLLTAMPTTALHAAARAGHGIVCTALVAYAQTAEERRRLLLMADSASNVPLHYAARLGHEVACRVLLESAETPDERGLMLAAVDRLGETVLHAAARRGHEGSCRTLLQLAPTAEERSNLLAAKDASGMMALCHASRTRHAANCSLVSLLEARSAAEEEDSASAEGRTGVAAAVSEAHVA